MKVFDQFSFTAPVFMAIAVFMLAPSVARAQTSAHVHGLANMSVALENDVLEVHFESPAANLVGFEHSAQSKQEKLAAKKVELLFHSPESIFIFKGSPCKNVKVNTDFSSLIPDEYTHHDEHGSHNESHDETHESEHGEVSVTYRFSCEQGQKLTSIGVTLFNLFSGLEKIEVLWVSEFTQGSQNLTPNNSVVSLK